MTTRKPHYVWRHYLQPWEGEEGKLLYSRNGTVLPPTNPVNLMAERDFYRLPRITGADANFLEHFVIGPTESAELRESHRKLVTTFRYIPEANEIVQSSDLALPDEKRNSQAFVIVGEDMLQGQIEQSALLILDELRQKRTDFINNYETAMEFFRFIAHQYFRTKSTREAVGEVLSQILPGHDFAHLRHIVCHIYAENLGTKPKPRWDVHLLSVGSRAGSLAGMFRPLTAGQSGSAVSLRLSG